MTIDYRKFVNVDKLAGEIAAGIGKTVMKENPEDVVDGYIEREGDNLRVVFNSDLTPEEIGSLDTIVENHVP